MILLATACSTTQAGPILFAAASTRVAVEEALSDWEGPPVRASYAASSMLGRQIEAGAPADVFLSAHPEWLEGEVFLRNEMVLVGTITDCVIVADEHVPAGTYARQGLGEQSYVSAADASAVVVMYEQAHCSAAAIYRTDLQEPWEVTRVLATEPIEYPMAALTPEGERLEAHLRARHEVFVEHGFR